MGVFSVVVEVGDVRGEQYEPMELVVDTGSSYTTLPASKLAALGVQPQAKQRFVLADGRVVDGDVGQVWLRIDGRALMTVVAFAEEVSMAGCV